MCYHGFSVFPHLDYLVSETVSGSPCTFTHRSFSAGPRCWAKLFDNLEFDTFSAELDVFVLDEIESTES